LVGHAACPLYPIGGCSDGDLPRRSSGRLLGVIANPPIGAVRPPYRHNERYDGVALQLERGPHATASGTGGVTRLSRRAQRFPRSDQEVHSVLANVSARSECALPKLLYLPRKALRPDSAARERRLYATRVRKLQRDVPDSAAISTRLFAFKKCRDVRKQFLATRLAHHTLVLARSTMRAALQSTNLTDPLRRLTYSAEPANVGLCAGIRPLEIRQKSK
jgi:hypothetical protein